LNGDGKPDLAVINATVETVSVLLNHGDGTFGDPRPIPSIEPSSLTVGDVDGDGNADLAVASDGSSVSVLFNHGDGTFAPAHPYGADPGNKYLTLADLDGDGRLDLVLGMNGHVFVLHNEGQRTFAAPVGYPVDTGESRISGPSIVAVADLDGDGQPDLAATNRAAGNVSVLRNRGDGTFAPQIPYFAGGLPTQVAAGDVNGDGRIDLVIANDTGLLVLVNTCLP
jgi:hypothetical protein